VTVYDAGEFEGGYSYIVMQFIDGESLSKKIEREQRVDQLTALRIIRDAAKALSTAHKQGMIHRDIKPDNIMLTKAGEVKVADFGLVKSADVEKDLSLSKSLLMGTPHYMAPEQFEGKPADPRVDIYALGVTFFELVTGKKPFDGKTAFKIMEAHLRQEPPKPESLSKEISPEVSKIILKMLEKEPEKRYQSADELIKDLDRVEGLLTGVKPAGEKKVPITAMVVVVVIVAAAIVGYFVYDNYRREKEEEARKVALENEAKTELDKLMTVVDELVAKNQFDTAFERLNSYPQQYQPTLSYSLWVSKRSDVLGRFKDYLSSQIASIAKDKDEKPEETVAVAEPVLRVAESVSRIIKGNEEIDKLRAQFGEIYKSLSETVTKAKDSYSSIERQMDEMRSNGDFERAKELLLPFVSSKVTSVRKSAQEQTKEFDRLIADAVRDFESAITRAEVKESKGDYEAAIKEIEKYKESKINSIKRKANEELGRLTQLKAGKENEQRLRESFDKQMRDVERMLEGGKGEAAADLCKELMKTPFTDLAQKAKEKLLYVKERMYKNMVYVAEGSFVMGSDEKSDNNPVRKVELKGFFIDRYEVTNAEYAEFVKATNRKPPEQWKGSEPPKGTENLPVVGVTLEDAKAYAAWCGKRLPTEEEWEKAASWDSVRGVKFRYPWGNEFSGDNANIGDKPGVVAVGSFVNDVSPYGVFDMAGNVAEFTSTMRSGKVVVRGASFKNITLTRARTSYSGYTVDPAKPFPDVGFRCARDDRW
jgi:serine/threonine protein kinase/formylglycine-generating enzyme required for sulfatase activity